MRDPNEWLDAGAVRLVTAAVAVVAALAFAAVGAGAAILIGALR